MKKITLLGVFLVSMVGFAQTNKQKIQTYFENNRSKYGLSGQDISDLTIQNEVLGSGTKITSCYVSQRYNGTEIYNIQANVSIKDGQVLRENNTFIANVAQKVNATAPVLTMYEAASRAYSQLGMGSDASFTQIENLNGKTILLSDGVQEDPITAKLVYQPMGNQLKLAWAFQFYTHDAKHYWSVRIDALNGQVLDKQDLTINCTFGNGRHSEHNHGFNFYEAGFKNSAESVLEVNAGSYRVIPYNYTSPNHSPFQVITSPSNALASPNGWHNANAIGGTTAGLIFTYSRGNNMLVQEDANGDNGTGTRADGGAELNFDFSYPGPTGIPNTYTNASITNLFYMTNIMHDVWYQYGFDEASGNFQQNNLGRGGVVSAAGDAVFGDAQDGYSQTTPTLNNANFTPTNDGVRPRIQMFMWDLGAPPTNFIMINSPAPIAGPRAATTNVFEGTDQIPVPVAPNGITADLVLYTNVPNNGTAQHNNPITIHNACFPATNGFELSGKIALIRRGNCNFSNKVKNAQDNGALAVIVYDTVPNNPVRLSMSSTGILGITIPAVFVTKEIGDALAAEVANGPVNATLEVPADLYRFADGSFDNVVIGHEYGHGISNRLVGGGLAGCMTNYDQMGEGWSDWFGLMMQIKAGETGVEPREIGTYVINQPNDGFGLRDFPYSTDMGVNPRTLVDSNLPIPADPADTAYRYKIGEFWASCLWDLTWAYVEKYGFDADIYTGTGGNNKVMRLVLDALKLENCNATNIVTGRDNLFAADQATTGGADYCLIADVFTRRGVGLNASAGSANDCNDQVEDFTAFPEGPNCTLGVNYFQAKDMFRVYPNPSNGTFNVRISQYVGKVSMQVVDINGRVVYNTNNEDFNVEKTVNLSHLQTGMYVLKVNGSEINFTQKLMIN
ncbi:T9SS-dependent M36 family metallopeptidase [Flavobacterium sp.]|uniref:T9SS-dependent M36 family metallopeptidase n=1 Tax=Flavobacterium sp. TaxID=239 RepID=UPI0039E655AA